MKRASVIRFVVVAGAFLAAIGQPPWLYADSNNSRAKMDLKRLERAAMVYKNKNGAWPESLEGLAKNQPDGGPSYVDAANLIDPWGNCYHYDPKQLNPGTGVPLIWTDGPPGSSGRFANWGSDPCPGGDDGGAFLSVGTAVILVGAALVLIVFGFVWLEYSFFEGHSQSRWMARMARFAPTVVLVATGILLFGLACCGAVPRYLE